VTIPGDVVASYFEVDIYDIVKICAAYGSKEGDPKYVPECDIYDIVKICAAYGSKEGDPKYVPECDINCDRKIDIYDVVIACIHYRQIDP